VGSYLEACHLRDDQEQEEREAQAIRVAEAQQRIASLLDEREWQAIRVARGQLRVTTLLVILAFTLFCAGTWIYTQARDVARQTSLVLVSAAHTANDAGYHDRALRFALLAARRGWLSSVTSEAETQLARAAYLSPLIVPYG
jgi:hypothetical protein